MPRTYLDSAMQPRATGSLYGCPRNRQFIFSNKSTIWVVFAFVMTKTKNTQSMLWFESSWVPFRPEQEMLQIRNALTMTRAPYRFDKNENRHKLGTLWHKHARRATSSFHVANTKKLIRLQRPRTLHFYSFEKSIPDKIKKPGWFTWFKY